MVLKCKLTFAHELGGADGAVEGAASARQSEAGRVGCGGGIPCCAHGVTRVARDLAVDAARVVEARGCGAGAVARFSCAGRERTTGWPGIERGGNACGREIRGDKMEYGERGGGRGGGG